MWKEVGRRTDLEKEKFEIHRKKKHRRWKYKGRTVLKARKVRTILKERKWIQNV